MITSKRRKRESKLGRLHVERLSERLILMESDCLIA